VTSLLTALAPLAAKKGAISGQQTVGALIIFGLLIGFGIFVVLTIMRRDPGAPPGSEIELAPNRKPYYDDEVLEGPRLDRALLICLGMLILIAIALPLYWLREPGRESNAERGFNNSAIKRGSCWFEPTTNPVEEGCKQVGAIVHFGCAGCHGTVGQGGQATFVVSDPAHPEIPPKQVVWEAPPLNTVMYRFTEDDTASPPVQEVRQIIVYGRAGTPMPPWGINGGGALDDQQISDLLAYIKSIQLSPAQAMAFWDQKAQETAKAEGSVDAKGNPIITGKVLFDTNCARCHTQGYSYSEPGVAGGGGQYGPNLTGGSELRQFPAASDQVTFVAQGVAPGKGYGTGGIMTDYGGGMPHFGTSDIQGKTYPDYLTLQEITEIVAYERSL
jgi:mono/diheme cytochrome c family protein